MAGAGGGYGQRIGEQGQAREGQGMAAGYYKTIDGQVRMRGEQRSGGVAKGDSFRENSSLLGQIINSHLNGLLVDLSEQIISSPVLHDLAYYVTRSE